MPMSEVSVGKYYMVDPFLRGYVVELPSVIQVLHLDGHIITYDPNQSTLSCGWLLYEASSLMRELL